MRLFDQPVHSAITPEPALAEPGPMLFLLDEHGQILLADPAATQWLADRGLANLDDFEQVGASRKLPDLVALANAGNHSTYAVSLGSHNYGSRVLEGNLLRMGAGGQGATTWALQVKEKTADAQWDSNWRLLKSLAKTLGHNYYIASLETGQVLISGLPDGADLAEVNLNNPDSFRPFIHPDDVTMVVQKIGSYAQISTGERVEFTYRALWQQRIYRWYHARVAPLAYNHQGRVNQVVIAVQDITESKLSEARVTETLKALSEFKAALDEACIICTTDASGRINYANQKLCDISGFSRAELLGSTHRIFHSGIHPQPFYDQMWKVLNAGQPWHGQICNKNKNGELFWLKTVIVPFLDSEGNVYQYLAIQDDITGLKTAERLLVDKESKLIELASHLKEVLFIKEWPSNETSFISPSFEQVWERPLADAYADRTGFMEQSIFADDLPGQHLKVKRFLAGEHRQNREYRIVTPSGNIKWLAITLQPVHDAHGRLVRIVGIAQDITARKQIERQQLNLNLQLGSVLESTGNLIYSVDQNYCYVFFNTAYKYFISQAFGAEVAIGGSKAEIQQLADDWTSTKQAIDRALAGTHNKELAHLNRPGQPERFFETNYSPIFNAEGVVTGVTVFAVDITDTLRAEQAMREARQAAEDASRAKENFLSMVSHEMRTPLNGVIGITHILLQENPGAHQLPHLKSLRFAAESLLALINDLLDFTKIDAGRLEIEKVSTNLRELVTEVVQSMRYRAEAKQLQLSLEIDPLLPTLVSTDPVRIAQIFNNLISNALKFTEKGQVEVKCQVEKISESSVTVFCQVKDTGIGIEEDKQDLVFDSFTQAGVDITRRFGGTGLGLSITRRILQLMGSQIHLVSQPGQGSTFYFSLELPLAVAKQATPALPDAHRLDRLKGLKVLLVEDNEINQMVATRLLRAWGIDYSLANNGKEAVQKVSDQNFDLVLMDLHMPEMDGYEAAQTIRAQGISAEALPIIALTASAMVSVRQRIAEAGMNDFVPKPFKPAELQAMLLAYAPARV